MRTAHKLVLLRHGQSEWNLEKRFTGWTDVDLTEKGKEEARAAGRILHEEGYTFDLAFTSVLRRAIKTLWIVQEEMNLEWIPVQKTWRLNERHYGALEGQSKLDTVAEYGEAQVELWRRGYDVLPPSIDPDDPCHPRFDRRYGSLLPDELPRCESLENVVERMLPYWHQTIAPAIRSGERVLVSAHGNTLRALVKYLDSVSDRDIVGMNIPTGIPLVYELDGDLRPTTSSYLGDKDKIQRAIESVVQQVKTER
jgi:phosphoglycerate mutase (EC 5.4.2.1)